MMNILTLKVGNKYDVSYVNNLYLSIRNNTTLPFKFFCYTENPEGLHEDINVVDLGNPKFVLQWNKIEFHKTGFAGIPEGEHCLILDIDQLVHRNFDSIIGHTLEEGQFGCFQRWWSSKENQEYCKI